MAPPSSSQAYAYKPGGSLKFKGGESVTGKKHKKKSRSSTNKDLARRENTGKKHEQGHGDDDDDGASTERGTQTVAKKQHEHSRQMTAAERKFEETRRKRLTERVEQKAAMSHKDRVDQFNKALADRTEHNDMLTVAGH